MVRLHAAGRTGGGGGSLVPWHVVEAEDLPVPDRVGEGDQHVWGHVHGNGVSAASDGRDVERV